jgi:DNA-binding NarL/FixJ family response regulator
MPEGSLASDNGFSLTRELLQMNQHTPQIRMIRVVIAANDPGIRAGLYTLLESILKIQVAGCASTGFEALHLCDRLAPDLVLMSLFMPVCDGVIGTRLIKSSCPKVKVLLIAWMEEAQNLNYALLSHADGYIFKPVGADKLGTAIYNTIHGIPQFDDEVFIL